MNRTSVCSAFVLLFATHFISGCTWIFNDESAPATTPPIVEQAPQSKSAEDPEPVAPKTTTVPVTELKHKREDTQSTVEITWVAPERAIDGYILRYGFSQNQLNLERRLRWSDLLVTSDPTHGKICTYRLEALPGEKTIYLTLAEENGGRQSAPTDVFEVHP